MQSAPEMFAFACHACGAGYGIERKKLGSRGIRIRCGQCGEAITVRPGAPPSLAEPPTSARIMEPGGVTSFDQCVSWLRTLMATPPHTSTDNVKDPWQFAPPCTLGVVVDFEKTHGAVLPRDYVRFITEYGNGTASGGPFPIFPLGMTVKDDGYGPLIPYDPPRTDALTRPFEHGLATWSGGDFEEEIKEYVGENGEPPPTFDAEVMPGSVPIAYEGCGEWCYLAVTGANAGMVWEWANGWMSPVPTPWLRPVSFPEWVLGEVARQRGLIEEFRQLTGVRPSPKQAPSD